MVQDLAVISGLSGLGGLGRLGGGGVTRRRLYAYHAAKKRMIPQTTHIRSPFKRLQNMPEAF